MKAPVALSVTSSPDPADTEAPEAIVRAPAAATFTAPVEVTPTVEAPVASVTDPMVRPAALVTLTAPAFAARVVI